MADEFWGTYHANGPAAINQLCVQTMKLTLLSHQSYEELPLNDADLQFNEWSVENR